VRRQVQPGGAGMALRQVVAGSLGRLTGAISPAASAKTRSKSRFCAVVHADSPQKPGFFAIAHGQEAQESLMWAAVPAFPMSRTGGTFMAKAAQPTVTLKHLAAGLAAEHEMAKKQSETILNDLVGMIVKHLKKGDRIRIGGLGILVVRKRAARMGRNPATGEPIKIKASKKVAFRAAKELKEAV
jgi:DNA-binding protein HU-beta